MPIAFGCQSSTTTYSSWFVNYLTSETGSRQPWKESCVSTGVRKPGNTCASKGYSDLSF